jgi:hypothetical protein
MMYLRELVRGTPRYVGRHRRRSGGRPRLATTVRRVLAIARSFAVEARPTDRGTRGVTTSSLIVCGRDS